jgi:glycerophosphoryl diester phosphodiesterase
MPIYDIDGNAIDTGDSSQIVNYDSIMKAINHRGYNTVAPENTIPAFKLSKRNGFNYVETDVQFSSDGIAVLIHDLTINRTARNADGSSIGTSEIYVKDLTYSQLLEYDFGIWKSAEYAGTKIPKFDDFIELCKNINLHPYIELKAGTQAQIEGLIDVVKNASMENNVSWISFNATRLGYVKTYDANARIGLLSDYATAENITTAQGLKTNTNEVFMNSGSRTAEAVQRCISADLPMEVYTLDNTSYITALDPYITGVTSNSLIAGKILYNANIN